MGGTKFNEAILRRSASEDYLQRKRRFKFRSNQKWWTSAEEIFESAPRYADVIDQAKRDGHDGVILHNTFDGRVRARRVDMTDVFIDVRLDADQVRQQ